MMAGLFVALAALAMIATLGAFYMSLRAAFGLTAHGFDTVAINEERAAMLAEKDAILAGIKELEFDQAIGKVGQADFEKLDKELRARARAVLRALEDDVRPYRAKAKALIEERLKDAKLGGTGEPYREKAEPAAPPPKDEPKVEPVSQLCASCRTKNDADAAFCKRCAKPLGEPAKAEAAVADAQPEPESQPPEPETKPEPESDEKEDES